MEINLNTPYLYGGGNLMIGFQVTTWGNSCSGINWYGVESDTYTAIHNHASSSHIWSSTFSLSKFLPKTTFVYTPALNEGCNIVGHWTKKDCYFPINTFYNYSITQQIYTQSEIGQTGLINSISFKYGYRESFSMAGVMMYMKITDKVSFGGVSASYFEPMTDADKVFEGTISATGSGWVTINLSHQFNYTGGNLIVCLYDQTNGRPGSGAHKFYYTPTDNYTSLTFFNESNSGSYLIDIDNLGNYTGSNKAREQYHANAKFCFSSCTPLSVSGLTVSQPDDADFADGRKLQVSWNPVDGATGYTLYYGVNEPGGGGVVREIPVSTTSYTANLLTNGVAYYFAVKAEGGDCPASNPLTVLDHTVTPVCRK